MAYVDPLPPTPGPDRPTTLDADTQAFLNALGPFALQLDALAGILGAAAAPGGFTIPYAFVASTAGDPTTGKLAVNNATQNVSTVIRASNTDALGGPAAGLLATMALSTSAIKGYARASKVGDASKWLVWRITGVTAQAGYYDLAGTIAGSSAANPFAAGDPLSLNFTPNGDTGVSALWTPILSNANVAGQTQITFTSIPTGYGDLEFIFDVTLSTAQNLYAAVSANNGSSWSSASLITQQSLTAYKGNLRFYDYRADISDWRSVISSGALTSPVIQDANGGQAHGNVAATGGINAVRLSVGAGTFSAGTIKPRAQ